MVFNQISQPRQRVSLRIAFSELDALSGSKTSGCTTSPHLRFSNRGRSGGSQTTPPMARALGPVQRPWQIGWFSNYFSLACHRMRFSNHDRSGGSQTDVAHEGGPRKFSNRGRSGDSQTPLHPTHRLRRFSNHGRSGGSQTSLSRCFAAFQFSNHGRSSGSQTCGCGYAV